MTRALVRLLEIDIVLLLLLSVCWFAVGELERGAPYLLVGIALAAGFEGARKMLKRKD